MKGCNRPIPSLVFIPLAVWLVLTVCLNGHCRERNIGDDPYLQALLQEADAKKIHENRYWWTLLHYRRTIRGIESRIDDPDFFLSPDGKTDPRAELRATLKAFREAPVPEKEPSACRFIARYHWLREKLSIDLSRAPMPRAPIQRCEDFERMLSEINPRSATLVFPTYHMNNPASMFGHTLLVIDTDRETKLLSQAVNYSALTPETNGFLFAVRGLFGRYRGYYAIQPYYRKIREYSDIHQRDIWEYTLNLSKSEIERLLRHLWELREIYSDYFFLDENCSYNLLFLLEAARPSTELVRRFPLWVLPVDTIKAIREAGLIQRVDYRPSPATRIRFLADSLGPENQKIALGIIDGTLSARDLAEQPTKQTTGQPIEQPTEQSMDRNEKIGVLDLCAEYLRYLQATRRITRSRYRETLLEVLHARSRLGSGELEEASPRPPMPDRIHDTGRLTVGTGIRDGDFFQEFGYRPAFSDLLETEHPSGQGAQIEFFNSLFRYYPEDRKLELEKLDFIHILSLSPRDRFFRPVSWKLRLGMDRKIMEDGDEELVLELDTGGGMAFPAGFFGTWFGLLEPSIEAARDLKKGYALGTGVSTGILTRITHGWNSLISARKTFFLAGDDHRRTEVSCAQSFRLRRNHSLNLAFSWKKAYDQKSVETVLNWRIYF